MKQILKLIAKINPACSADLETDIGVFHTLLSQTGDGEVLAVLLEIDLACAPGLGSAHFCKTKLVRKLLNLSSVYTDSALKSLLGKPVALLHVGSDLIHVDLRVQQSGEVSRAGLSGSGHLQVVQLQPEVGIAHRAVGVTARGSGGIIINTF